MQCSEVQSAVKCSLQCSAVQCSVVHFSAMQCSAVQCSCHSTVKHVLGAVPTAAEGGEGEGVRVGAEAGAGVGAGGRRQGAGGGGRELVAGRRPRKETRGARDGQIVPVRSSEFCSSHCQTQCSRVCSTNSDVTVQ